MPSRASWERVATGHSVVVVHRDAGYWRVGWLTEDNAYRLDERFPGRSDAVAAALTWRRRRSRVDWPIFVELQEGS